MFFSVQHLQEIGSGSMRSLEAEQAVSGQRSPPVGTSSQEGCNVTKLSSRGQKKMGSFSRGKVIFARPALKGISPKEDNQN